MGEDEANMTGDGQATSYGTGRAPSENFICGHRQEEHNPDGVEDTDWHRTRKVSVQGSDRRRGVFHQINCKGWKGREGSEGVCAQTPGRNVPLRQRAGGGERMEARWHEV